MYKKYVCTWVLAGCIGLGLIAGPAQATPLAAPATELANTRLADTDLDGVDDAADLCPGTPAGTAVNAYGCPLSLATCDYTTATVTLNTNGGSSGAGINTRYVLADNAGTILQVSATASFTGLSGTATYMALALTYDGAVSNLTVGNSLSAVSASCFDWSDALVFKACIATPNPPTCDYQIGSPIVLKTAGGSTGAGVRTTYVLTDVAGKLMLVSATPTFATGSLVAGTYSAYALTYTDDASIANLVVNGTNTLSQVTASCLAVSPAVSLLLCGCPVQCIPVVISRLR